MPKIVEVYNEIPHCCVLGVKTLIINDEGKVLMLRRSDGIRIGGWDFTGGMVELGEDPEVAAKREVKEESGLEVKDLTILGTFSKVRSLEDGRVKHTVIIGYSALAISTDVRLSEEHDLYEWVDIEEAKTIDLPPEHRKLLSDFISSTI